MYEEEATPREKKISRNLAIGIHVLIIVLFIFGVSWHRRQQQAPVEAELWGTMAPPRPEPRPEPPLKISPRIEKEPTPTPPPPPKPEVKPVPKPDIALREKLEKERKLKEQQELERKKDLERKRELERQKEEEAKKLKTQQLAEQKKKEEERKKFEQERELERQKEEELKRQLAQKEASAKAAASAQRQLYDKYVSLIQSRIRSQIVEPPNLQGNPQVEFTVVLIPGGEVLSARMTRTSGVPAYDQAVERAILKASPLPLPPDPALFSQFRELHLKIRPKE